MNTVRNFFGVSILLVSLASNYCAPSNFPMHK